jgi:hypothetical protein
MAVVPVAPGGGGRPLADEVGGRGARPAGSCLCGKKLAVWTSHPDDPLPDEVGERDVEGLCDEEQVTVLGVADPGLVPLDAPPVQAYLFGELVL